MHPFQISSQPPTTNHPAICFQNHHRKPTPSLFYDIPTTKRKTKRNTLPPTGCTPSLSIQTKDQPSINKSDIPIQIADQATTTTSLTQSTAAPTMDACDDKGRARTELALDILIGTNVVIMLCLLFAGGLLFFRSHKRLKKSIIGDGKKGGVV
jgi:hypothetical protein